jgi:hypothetical protein
MDERGGGTRWKLVARCESLEGSVSALPRGAERSDGIEEMAVAVAVAGEGRGGGGSGEVGEGEAMDVGEMEGLGGGVGGRVRLAA